MNTTTGRYRLLKADLGGTPASLRVDGTVPCTTDGCQTMKFFAGRCNVCTAKLEGPTRALPTTSWVEECMAKQRG